MKEHTTRHDDNLPRLARIEGQVRAVKRMVEEGAYCIDIITQIQAVRAALQSTSRIILERHLQHCVSDAVRSKDESEIDEKLEEIMSVIKRMGK